MKQERSITPKLIFIRGGQDDATIFENYLIEEQDVDGSGLTSVMGFVSFLEEISQSVVEYMKQKSHARYNWRVMRSILETVKLSHSSDMHINQPKKQANIYTNEFTLTLSGQFRLGS